MPGGPCKRASLLGALVFLLLAAATGCQGGGAGTPPKGGGNGDPAPAGKTVKRPKFLVYETKVRQVVTEALGRTRERKFRRKIYASAQALRTEDPAGGPTVIMRLDRKVMWQLDAKKRVYSQATFGEYAQRFENDRKLLSMQLRDKKLPAAKRRALEVLLGLRRPKVAVKVDPEPAVLLGRACRRVRHYEGGLLRVEAWAADGLVSPCNLNAVLALTGDFSPELLKKLRGRPGFGLKTRIVGRLPTLPRITETEVTSLKMPEKLSPALFEIPPGYRKYVPPSRRPAGRR